MFLNSVLVAVGGFCGAVSRFFISKWIKERIPFSFPFATMTVNLLGSFLLGWVMGARLDEQTTLLAATGFLGAFTTFSTFKLENIHLLTASERKTSLLYMGVSYTGGILLAFAGLLLAGG
ncbi:fluoride efflux transporter CrcB [Thalassobacillus sp. CUG 92003]|uniref:fluoride efflux transporter CrcB n=1 Tax=Thalassobacillus sp. CUG 92003 TaxID=2736641 RepID=UPI0015E725D4|nr:fluoride efflux transporter CrcB [Thalassobacillus sp. CUG 92003]